MKTKGLASQAMVDRERAERAVRELLLAVGEDPDREGLDDETAAHAFRTLVGYVIGFALIEIGALVGGQDAEDHRSVDPSLVPSDQLAHLARLVPHFQQFDPDQEFEFGLDTILAGMRPQ